MAWFFFFIFFAMSMNALMWYDLYSSIGLDDPEILEISAFFMVSSGLCYVMAQS